MTQQIGILLTGFVSEQLEQLYVPYEEMFRLYLGLDDFTYRIYRVYDNELPRSVDDCDSWLVTGSQYGVYETHSWMKPLEQVIRDIHSAVLPCIGICFGHQIMAQAMGGIVQKHPGGWAIGRHLYHISTDIDLKLPLDKSLRLLCIHQDQVVKKPAQSQVFLTSEFCPIAGLYYYPGCVSFQPHPEFHPDYLVGILTLRRGENIDSNLVDQAMETIHHQTDSQILKTWIKSYLQQK